VEKIKKAGGTIEVIIPGKELENMAIAEKKQAVQDAKKAAKKAKKA
jgi:hypothetical protein